MIITVNKYKEILCKISLHNNQWIQLVSNVYTLAVILLKWLKNTKPSKVKVRVLQVQLVSSLMHLLKNFKMKKFKDLIK